MTEIAQATNSTAIMGFAQVTNNIENILKESSELFMLAKKINLTLIILLSNLNQQTWGGYSQEQEGIAATMEWEHQHLEA